MKTTISQRLMDAVQTSGLKQVDFGIKIGASKQVVSAWKNGREVPDKYVIKSIILLNLDANWILKGEESKHDDSIKEQIEMLREAMRGKDELLKAKDELLKMKDEIHKLSNGKI